MNVNAVEISQALKLAIQGIKDFSDTEKRQLIAVALGRTVALTLDLPPRVQDSIRLHYSRHLEEVVRKVVSEVNEIYLLDVPLVCDVTSMFYEFRYNLAYNPSVFASMIDRLTTWSDDVLPDRIKSLTIAATAKPELIAQLENMTRVIHTGVCLKNELSGGNVVTPSGDVLPLSAVTATSL